MRRIYSVFKTFLSLAVFHVRVLCMQNILVYYARSDFANMESRNYARLDFANMESRNYARSDFANMESRNYARSDFANMESRNHARKLLLAA